PDAHLASRTTGERSRPLKGSGRRREPPWRRVWQNATTVRIGRRYSPSRVSRGRRHLFPPPARRPPTPLSRLQVATRAERKPPGASRREASAPAPLRRTMEAQNPTSSSSQDLMGLVLAHQDKSRFQ